MIEILLSDPDEKKNPLYLQIYKQFRDQILRGEIASHTRLPSVRALQLQLNISKTPIEAAYQMLAAEGFIYSKARSGFYAVELEKIEWQPHENRIGEPLPASPAEEKKYIIDFNPSAVDEESFPIRTWKKLLHQVLEDHAYSIGQYGDMKGELLLRKAIADYIRSARGVHCSPEQIIIGSGISYSISLLTRLIKGIRQVAFEEPGFEPVREQLLQNGYEVIPIGVNHEGFDVKKLEEEEAQMIYVTPSHQFPTGRVMPYAEREYLLHWANKQDAYIIEDDYDGEFRYIGKPIPSLQSIDYQERVIYIGTFSKALTPALRMNYMVLPNRLLKDSHLIRPFLSCPSRIEQWAMHAFITQGHWYRNIRKMRNKYRKKHAIITACIQEQFADKIEITGHSAGLHLQILVKTKSDETELIKLAEDKGVRVYGFQEMWLNQSKPSYPSFSLGFAGVREEDLVKGILLLKEAWFRDF